MFSIGEYVVYGSGEICRIAEKTERCFDGKNGREYCKLIPLDSVNSTYYVPADSMDSNVRKLLTKEQIYNIIDSMPEAEGIWFNDKNTRREQFGAMLRSDDFSGIIGMMKSIYEERRKRSATGKQLIASDEKAFTAAENLINREFAIVLGINVSEVENFIHQRLAAAEISNA